MSPENLAIMKRHFGYLPQAEFDALIESMDKEAERLAYQAIIHEKTSNK